MAKPDTWAIDRINDLEREKAAFTAEIAELRRWKTLCKEICEEWNEKCDAECDSVAHTETCKATFIAEAKRALHAEIAELRRQVGAAA